MLLDFLATVVTMSMRFLFRFLIIFFIRQLLLLFRLPLGVGTFPLYCGQLACSLFGGFPHLDLGVFHEDGISNIIECEFALFRCLESVRATLSNIPKRVSCGLYKNSGSGEMRLMG